MFKSKTYTLHKSRQALQYVYDWYRRHWRDLSSAELKNLEQTMEELDQVLRAGDREKATPLAQHLETFAKKRVKRNPLTLVKELFVALILALAIATVVRQSWFELYQIPTGSMRPNFREKDHLLVSKTAFGINVPIKPGHLYFDKDLPKRTGIVIFSGHNLDLEDIDDKYFWLFPYTKRYIKRLIGKPGDTLYFYGGKIYGIDREGNGLTELLDESVMANVEHIPFIHLEGRLSVQQTGPNSRPQLLLRHFGSATARIAVGSTGQLITQIFDGKQWISENPIAAGQNHDQVQTYHDLYGMGNFALARLLTEDQVRQLTDIDVESLAKAPLYLELRHHPLVSLSHLRPQPLGRGGSPIQLFSFTSVIPLGENHLNALMDTIYTNRFIMKDGLAIRYGLPNNFPRQYLPEMNIADGTYELYFGKAYRVGRGGGTVELPADHPLLSRDPEHVQKMFNLGIDMLTPYEPHSKNQNSLPSRYAYFRDGNLYLMGSPVMTKDDPVLQAFVENEKALQAQGSAAQPYAAFVDRGPPLKADGSFDTDFIKTFGVKVPERHYLALGDNHAFSSDSRYFGFVPESNLRGSPRYILWPFGQRWGTPKQPAIPYWNAPTVFVLLFMLSLVAAWYWWLRLKHQKPIYKKLSP